MAMQALAAHKLRAALTLVGVTVGVFSIIMVMTAMRVLQNNIETELSELGAHTFTIDKWPGISFEGPKGWEKYRRRKPLTLANANALRDRVTLATAIGAESYFWRGEASSDAGKTNPDIPLIGVTPEVFLCKSWVIEEGRTFLRSDLENGRYICVLGNGLAKKLFPRRSAVGQSVKFDGIKYAIVGVLEAKGGMGGQGQDNFITVPINLAMNRYSSANLRSLTLYVQAPNQLLFEDCVEQARSVLRAIRKVPPGEEDDFEIFSNDSLIDQFRSLTLAVRIGVAVISSIALLAAGIGIMNIMLVSVTERTREIGIRRAVGAKKRNIMTQFILEAIVICEVGGVIGVVLGIAGGNITAFVFKAPPVIPVDWAVIGLVICSIVGIVFGTYPAIKAANLDPIDSLRYE